MRSNYWLIIVLIATCIPATAFANHHNKQHIKMKDVGEIRGIINYCGREGSGGILAYIPGKSFMVKTGPDGQFIFHYVPAATHILAFEIPGQVPYLVRNIKVPKGRVVDLGTIDYCMDADNDGYDASIDCNDGNSAVHPGATEICDDGIDNNCNNSTDEGCQTCIDADNDSYYAQQACETPVDCNDSNANIHPGRSETCGDGIDNNCNGNIDEQCGARDEDEDGYPSTQDCNDNDPMVNPGASELCDGRDNNCDGTVDDIEPTPCEKIIGVCSRISSICVDGQWTVCDYTTIPQFSDFERCDNLDNDCDGQTDEDCQ